MLTLIYTRTTQIKIWGHVFDSLSLDSIAAHSKDEISVATLTQKLGINSERERVHLSSEITIGAVSVEQREIQVANM